MNKSSEDSKREEKVLDMLREVLLIIPMEHLEMFEEIASIPIDQIKASIDECKQHRIEAFGDWVMEGGEWETYGNMDGVEVLRNQLHNTAMKLYKAVSLE
jgi:hypothetical protein